ncbi:MAG TPA: Co2+/Mg2+ efflux protein ApaG [Candidatus Competibacteraceae bacterium]|nr:Co2+/Mg2+ efflux protein ApaG [Candidatus Competibacteraceae bacterium]
MSSPAYNIKVSARSFYIEEQSNPDLNRYVFAYTITIQNQGTVAAKLLSRHWIITDANGKVEEVRGEGVVGEQPYLRPGEGFQYTSGAILETPVGAMRGSYQMLADDGVRFEAQIPAFGLSVPRVLH